MGKSIIITESQYSRLLLNEQEENKCLKKTKRLYWVNKDLVENHNFPSASINPHDKITGCHIGYEILSNGLKFKFYFRERPNYIYITIESLDDNTFNFNLGGKLSELGEIKKIVVWWKYSLTGSISEGGLNVDTNQLAVINYTNASGEKIVKNSSIVFNNLTINKILSSLGVLSVDSDGGETNKIKSNVTDEMGDLVSDFENEINGWVDQDNFENILKKVYDNFHDKCGELRKFIHAYASIEKVNFIQEVADFGVDSFDDEYASYRNDVLIPILNDGYDSGKCDPVKWSELKKITDGLSYNII